MENTLGLDVHGATASQPETQPNDTSQSTASPRVQRSVDTEDGEETPEDDPNATSPQPDDKGKKEKGKPYVPATPPVRAKVSPEELAQRMAKIRLQNEKIKERREHVKADEEAFNTSIAADRAKQAANRKVQAQINQNREQNAKRKLEKMGNREWDSGKQGEWKQGKRPTEDKGRGDSFSSGPVRNAGGPRPPTNNRNTTESSSMSATSAKEPAEGSLREAAPHIAQEHSDGPAPLQPQTQEGGNHE